MRGSDGKLCFCENGRGNVWKDYMERNMTEEDDWHHNIEDAVEGVRRCSIRSSKSNKHCKYNNVNNVTN